MMRRRTAAVAVFLLAMLAAPRRSDAGVLDFIWEMSGPQMLGPSIGCMLTFKGELRRCLVSPLLTQRMLGDKGFQGPFLYVAGEYTFSTGKNAGGHDYKFFNTHRLAFAPQLMVRSTRVNNIDLFHAAGITYEYLFGVDDADFPSFDKFGFVFTPVEFAFPKFSIAPKIRVYPNGYTADEFGFGPPPDDPDRKHEWTYGLSVSFPLKIGG